MLKNTDDASSPSEENSARDAGFISLEKFTPLVKGAANQLMQFVQRQEGMPHTEDTEVMESVTGQTSAESTVQNTVTTAENDKPKSSEHADLFNSALKTALQEYVNQQQRLQQYIEQTDKLSNDVDRLAGMLEETERERQHLLLQNSRTTEELNGKIEELSSAIHVTNEQQQQLVAATQHQEELCSTIGDYELRCQTLEMRSREADALESKVEDLNAALATQASKINEIQTNSQALGNDNEILKQSLDEAEQSRLTLEEQNTQATVEFTRKLGEVTEALRTAEEQHRQLEALHSRSTAEFTTKIEGLTGALQTAEEQRQQLEVQNSQSTTGFNARIGELTSALQAAEEQWQQLELQHGQSTATLTARVTELSSALQASEDQRLQLETEKQQITAELTHRVEDLSGTLQVSEDQRQQLEAEKQQVTAELTHRVEELSGTLQASEDQRQQLETEKQQVTAELTHRVEELSGTLQVSEARRQLLETEKQQVTNELVHKIEVLSGALQNSEDLRHRLAHRASQADKLDAQVIDLNSEIEGLSSKLKVQENKFSELQLRLNSANNDNEIMGLSLKEKEALVANLETAQQQATTEFTHRVEELSAELQNSEQQRQSLAHRASEADKLDVQVANLNREIERLTSGLRLQEDKASELQFRLNSVSNDNEIIKLSLADKEVLIEDLETGQQVTTELTHKVDELSAKLQVSEGQRQQFETEKQQLANELTRKIDELTNALQVSEDQRLQLDAEKHQATSELTRKVEELSAALQDSESQRNLMSQASAQLTHKVEGLSGALQESIEQRQSVEDRARHADKLEAENTGLNDEIERLNSELLSQANNARVAELKFNGFNNDIELLNLSLEDKNRSLQQMESKASAQQTELARKVEALSAELQSAEELNLQLQTEKDRETSEFTGRIEELTVALRTAEEQRQKLNEQAHPAEPLNDQTNGLQHEVERLAAALHVAEQQRETLEQRARQADEINSQTSELQHEVNRLSSALQLAEQQRETLTQRASKADELGKRVEELTTELHQAQQQRQLLERDAGQAEQLNNQTGELQHEVERLAAALQEAEQQRETLAQRASLADELSKRVEQLSDALHASEEQRQQLVEHSEQASVLNSQTAELKDEIERLTTALQLAKIQAGETAPAAGTAAPVQAPVPETTGTSPEAASTDTLAEATSGSQSEARLPEVNSQDSNGQDALTGLLNRQGFMQKLEVGIKEFPESEQEQAVLYVLVDNFTGIREATGVAASDNIIAEISRLLMTNCSPQDTVARFGDCVFTILHHDADVAGIENHAEKLLHAIEDYVSEVNGQAVMTTASIGICVINDYTTDPDNILNRADLACEVARSSGGNQLQIHSTIIDEQLSHENMDEWGELIRKTLDDERFYLVYQPIICLGEDLQKRYEVLLRIVDEDGKIVLPGKFMSLAENLGLSREIDLWVIDSALKKLAESNDSSTLFFIKLSVNSLQDSALPRWIQDKLTAYSLNSASVVFEIPESIAINNLKNAMLFTRAMRTLGCKVALEHYAAATQPQLLKHIQTDYLKIDGALISSLAISKESRTSVRAIVDRGKQYNLICVAEHVDSAASLALLWELGAAFAQGNFIQEPSKEIDYDFFGEIETHDIPHAPDYQLKSKTKSEFV